ncbi:MAG: gliding motility-associated C-terminal domain-containing protein [Bacteroidia bacterium]
MRCLLRIASLIFFLAITTHSLHAQRGKHGALVVTNPNVIVNEFTALSNNITAGDATITVANSSLNTNNRFNGNLQAGDLVMIIQMQGATIKTFTAVPGQDSTYGEILNYNNAGNFEFAQVFAVPSSSQIVFDCGLQYNYTANGKVQIVRVPRYNTLTINSGASITSDAWNGQTGGVISVEVLGTTTINGTVTATGLGFRGGQAANNGAFGGGRFVDVGGGANEGGAKGESIAGSVTDYQTNFNGQYAKGAPANGGGGGNSHNAGGAGGANAGNISAWRGTGTISPTYSTAYALEYTNRETVVSSGGGRGGYCFSSANLNPLSIAPGNASWGGDARRNQGGFGGRPLDYSTGKIFLGGGGGAGHVNNISASNTGGTGGNGGGLIYFACYNDITGSGYVVSNGASGVTATGPNPGFSSNVNGIDAAGGGGGGGTILMNATGTLSAVNLIANGGKGGDQIIVKGVFAGSNTEAEGPGGGGGGGYIAFSAGSPNQSVSGAISGTTNSTAMTNFPPNGSSDGGDGLMNQTIKLYEITANDVTVCINSAATLSATTNNTSAVTFNWYNSAAGASLIATGSSYTTQTFTASGTYTYYVGMCSGSYREPVLVTVLNSPTVSVNSATICGAQTVTLTASGASTYSWNTGPTTSTIAVNPTVTTSYTVTGVNGCSAQATATVEVQALPSFTIGTTNTLICNSQTISIFGNGTTGTYSWSNGGTTPTINVSTGGIYTATLTNNCGTTTQSINIVEGPPTTLTISANTNTICSGGTVTLTAVGSGTYAWSTTTVNTPVITVSTSGVYFVTLTNECGTNNASITIGNGPQPTVNIIPASTVFCSGQPAILTATGATSYTWSTGANTPTMSTTSAGVYTVVASNSCGISNAVITVTFANSPDVSVSADRYIVCPNQTAVLTATNLSGGGNFSWSSSPSNTTNIESGVGPGIYTVFYNSGCGAAQATVAINQSIINPGFTFTPNGGTVPLNVSFINTSQGNTSNAWDFGNGTFGNSITGSAQYNAAGIYTVYLTIQNIDGCTALTSNTIEVTDLIVKLGEIPQLITNNGDGKNETFEIINIQYFPMNKLQIYNRWGNLVYEMDSYDNSFDGTPNYKSNKSKLPAGTYYYILEFYDDVHGVFKGFFQLVY